MKTYNIHHEVGIKASAKAVYQALTDTKKLKGWWTSDTRGNGSKVRDILEFWFGEFCHKFEVVELQPDKIVRWKAYEKEGIDEWAGTEIAFSLNADEKQCFVHFSHSGWRKDSGIFPHCSTKWAVFMLSLKDAAHLLPDIRVRILPETLQILRHGKRPSGGREQMDEHFHPPPGDRPRIGLAKKLLEADGKHRLRVGRVHNARARAGREREGCRSQAVQLAELTTDEE